MFKTAATKIAHNSTIPALAGNQDLRPLQDLITAEKAVIMSLQRLSVDFAKASEALRLWGSGEGDDLGDSLNASSTLLSHFSAALSQYASHGHPMREYLKSIRTKEENLDELKRRRKAVTSKADAAERKLSKMSPEHKNLHMQTDSLNVLRAEIRTLDSDIMSEEAALGDFKRTTTRQWMGLKFGGLLECTEKGIIAGEYGKQVIAEVPEERAQPGMARSLYYGHAKTQSLVSEALRCMNEVQLSTSLVPGPPAASRPGYPHAPNLSRFDSATPSSVVYQHDASPPGGAPPNYIAPQQGLGTGQLFDNAWSSIPPSPNQPIQMPPYPQIESHRSVDDFGVTHNKSNGAEGRFATYPEKARPGGIHGGYMLHDGPPLLHSPHEANSSFSSSVNEALGPSHQPPSNLPGQFGSIRGPAPMYTPPQESSSWTPTHTRGNPSNASYDDTVLAYTATDEQRNEGQGEPHGDDHIQPGHVRFGEVSNVDEEIERRGGPHQPSSSSQQQHPPQSAMRSSLDSARESPHVGTDPPSQQFSQHIPPPALSREDEERELNAAAAREVSREMDVLTFNPPVPPKVHGSVHDSSQEESPDPSAVQHSRGPGFGGSPGPDLAPLAPPSAPFAHRSPSPRPTIDSSMVPPYLGASPSTMTPAQIYAQSHLSSPTEERISLEHDSPVVSYGPRLNTAATPASHMHDDVAPRSSPLASHTPYQTPPEYQRTPSAGNSPAPNFKSPSSNNLPPGPRTISAAAFKRPQPRMLSGELPVMDTSPLSLKKHLPSSPHPQQRDSRSISLPPLPPGNSTQSQDHNATGEQKQGNQLEEDYDYLSAYVNSGTLDDAGSLGPLKIANEADEGDSHRAQYGHDQGYGRGGYGDGRFATDLEELR